MRSRLILLLLVLNLSVYGQDTLGYEWISDGSIEIDSTSYWTLDGLNNSLTISKGEISKIDSVNVVKFSQSIKSLGGDAEILPINAMKIMHFSREQQSLCFLDNTLTQVDDCIDLTDFDVVNAQLISTSSRPDMIWIFDNLNSSLSLTAMHGDFTKQETINLNGLLDIDSVIQMVEFDGRLHLLDSKKGIYVFDMLGSLIEHIEMKNVKSIEITNETIFALGDNELYVRTSDSPDVLSIKLPENGIEQLKFRAGVFYFRAAKNVHKYTLQF